MSDSEYVRGSGRKGAPRPPRGDSGRSKVVTCQTCKKPNVMVYNGQLERHKVYKLDKNGRKTSSYSYCDRKKP